MPFNSLMPFNSTKLTLCGLFLFAATVGCGGPSDDATVPIAGNVTLDGTPLPDGVITLLPSDGKGPTAGAPIKEGRYETRAEPGPKSVTIVAQRPAAGGKAPADPHAGPATEQYIPAKYNSKTTLTADVPDAGSETLDFQLESK